MGYPFQRLHLDYLGPLNEGLRTGGKHILMCRDSFSKWVEVFPKAIHSDCGTQFKSNLFTEIGEALGMNITDTSGYNPKGNGQVERMHRDLNGMLVACLLYTSPSPRDRG